MEVSQILTILGWVLSPVCASLVTYIITKRKSNKAHEEAMQKGMLVLLRQKLIDYHRDTVASGKPCPVRIKEQATAAYEAYAALGGNGTGKQLWQEIMEAHVE
jgi:hypothetical protein